MTDNARKSLLFRYCRELTRKRRRLDADRLDPIELARHLLKAADAGVGAEPGRGA
jgi:hypothetical protein